MPQQLGQPFRILHIGLAPRNVLDVARVSDHQLEVTLQDRVHGYPIHPRALHDHVRAPLLQKPIAKLLQGRHKGPKLPNLLSYPMAGRPNQDAGHHLRLPNVDTTALLMKNVHSHLPLKGEVTDTPRCSRNCHACFPLARELQNEVPSFGAGQSVERGCHRRSASASVRHLDVQGYATDRSAPQLTSSSAPLDRNFHPTGCRPRYGVCRLLPLVPLQPAFLYLFMISLFFPTDRPEGPGAEPAATVIRAGTLLDGRSDQPRRGQVIVVRGRRIEAVGDAASTRVPPDAATIDLSGATVLPGLIDSHTHIFLQGE